MVTLVSVCFPFPLNQETLSSNFTLLLPSTPIFNQLWFQITTTCMWAHSLISLCVSVRAHMNVYLCLFQEVKEMLRTSPAIKSLTPDLVSDHQIAKCFPYGSFHIGSHICPQSSSSFPPATETQWHKAHKSMTSGPLMFFRFPPPSSLFTLSQATNCSHPFHHWGGVLHWGLGYFWLNYEAPVKRRIFGWIHSLLGNYCRKPASHPVENVHFGQNNLMHWNKV